jgi:glycosyltransferase involved in cell wall biosynthesis
MAIACAFTGQALAAPLEGAYPRGPMAEVLFVSKPVAPPWNDSSKNLVRDIAGHLRRHTPVVMGRPGQACPIEGGRIETVYGPATAAGFAPSVRENLGVLRHLMLGRSTDLWHFFFAPNPKSSAAGRVARAVRRVPSVHTVCSVPAEDVAVRKLLFADATVALSRFAYERFRREGVGESALRVIPPSVPPLAEPTTAEREALRAKHALPTDVPVWIYPGDLEFGRGAEITLEAFAASGRQDAVLLMACRRKTAQADEALARLEGQVKRWGLESQVRWVGETREIHELLALSDFVVMVNETAYAKMDYPLVALEAMSLARPVLVGTGTPSAELAEEGGAVAVETDGEALATAIENLSADQAGLAKLGAKARALATSRFSPQEVAAAYELLYEEIHG